MRHPSSPDGPLRRRTKRRLPTSALLSLLVWRAEAFCVPPHDRGTLFRRPSATRRCSAPAFDETTEWSSLTVVKLREQIKALGLKNADYKKKADLVACLENLSKLPKENIENIENIEKDPKGEETSGEVLAANGVSRPANGASRPANGASQPANGAFARQHNPRAKLRRMPRPDASILGDCSEQDWIESTLRRRYPTLPSQAHWVQTQFNFTGVDRDPRSLYHPIFTDPAAPAGAPGADGAVERVQKRQSDMDLIFLGTASCIPGTSRGVSCVALRLNWKKGLASVMSSQKRRAGKVDRRNPRGDGGGVENVGGTWLFDCGEGSQIQLQKATNVKTAKITKIFVTHAHGDHSFGLPGILCLIGQGREKNSPPIDIYGPEGLRMWLRTSVRYSVSRIVPPFRVHELKDCPMSPNWKVGPNGRFFNNGQVRTDTWKLNPQPTVEDPLSWLSNLKNIKLEANPLFGEVEGGRDIYPQYDHPKCVDNAPVYVVEEEEDVAVYAAPMAHGVPCVGYVIKEADKAGRLKADLVAPILKRNFQALIDGGVKDPMKLMAHIKKMKEGDTFTMPDGTVIVQSEVVEPPQKGRIVAICGDTSDASAMAGIAHGADVLVHEATNTHFDNMDQGTYKQAENDAVRHGHSTPLMAGEFAGRIRAKRLLMNHFSPRYPGDPSIESIRTMTRIEKQAMDASGLPETAVVAVWDFMSIPIPYSDAKSKVPNDPNVVKQLKKMQESNGRKLSREKARK